VSKHSTPVFVPDLLPHPNADSLSLVKVPGTTYQVVTRTDSWQPGQLAAWIEPDSLVDTRRPEFDFLADRAKYTADSEPQPGAPYARVTAIRLRGELSYGLLVPLDTVKGSNPPRAHILLATTYVDPVYGTDEPLWREVYEGADATDALGIEHYEPPVKSQGAQGGDSVPGPAGYFPTYDVEALAKYERAFTLGESIVATEKIHGANARFVYVEADDRVWCGSRREWKAPGSLWHRALDAHPEVEEWLRRLPGYTLYGEVYGPVQSLRYGLTEPRIAIFDVLRPDGTWLSWDRQYSDEGCLADLYAEGLLPMVPLLEIGSYDPDLVESLATGSSRVPGAQHIREGVVIRPVRERRLDDGTRCVLKAINPDYLVKEGK
jgi:RNA ligase (TIGR02306 family)